MHQQFSRCVAVADFVDGACIAAAKAYNAMAADVVVVVVDDIAVVAAFEIVAILMTAWECGEIECSIQNPEIPRAVLKSSE